MKTTSKKVATKATVVKKAPITQNKEDESKYELTVKLNAQVFGSKANGLEVFALIPKPLKYVTKGIFTLENKETGKSFEAVYPPYLTRKLLTNAFVQNVQWKRMSAKVD